MIDILSRYSWIQHQENILTKGTVFFWDWSTVMAHQVYLGTFHTHIIFVIRMNIHQNVVQCWVWELQSKLICY